MLWVTHRALKSKKVSNRRKAVEALVKTPNVRAIGILAAALDDSDAAVRGLAATALGKLEDPRCLEPLLAALNDREPEVQQAAMLALKGSLDPRVGTALVPLLHHPNAGTRGQAAQILESLGWRSTNRQDEIWFQVARGKFSRAASFGAACIPVLETVLDSGPSSLSVAAVQALGQIEDENVLRPLFRALKSADPSVCVAAVGALAKMDKPEAIEPLIAGLRHRSTQVRLAAVEALGVLRATAAVEHMRPLLRDSHWDVRRAAAEALGRLKDARAVEALADRLYDGDADVREAVAISLGSIGDRQAISPLVLALKDANSGVRRIAAGALSRIDSDWSSSPEARASLDELKSSLEDNDSDVRHFIGQLLVGLGSVEPEAAGEADLGDQSASTAEKRRKLAVSLFVAILCDADRDLRQAAAEALGRLGDRRGESSLTYALADPDPWVRHAAGQSLPMLAATPGGG